MKIGFNQLSSMLFKIFYLTVMLIMVPANLMAGGLHLDKSNVKLNGESPGKITFLPNQNINFTYSNINGKLKNLDSYINRYNNTTRKNKVDTKSQYKYFVFFITHSNNKNGAYYVWDALDRSEMLRISIKAPSDEGEYLIKYFSGPLFVKEQLDTDSKNEIENYMRNYDFERRELCKLLVKKKYKLSVEGNPGEATVKIINIKKKFHQEILLPPGDYELQIENPGYEKLNKTIKIIDEDRTVTFHLKRKIDKSKKKCKLFVNVDPKEAQVKIMNIKEKFHQGILLYPGEYELQIEMRGYEKLNENLTIADKDITRSYRLKVSIEECKIEKGLELHASELGEMAYKLNQKDSKSNCKAREIEEVKEKVSACNRIVDSRILTTETNLFYLELLRKDIENNELKGLKTQILDKQDKLNKVKESIWDSISKKNFKGLYLVCIKYKMPYVNTETLSIAAKKLILPHAVEDLNGYFIDSVTTIKNGEVVGDSIEMLSSGSFSIEKVHIGETHPDKKIFIYLVEVSVSHLRSTPSESAKQPSPAHENLIELMNDGYSSKKLEKFGLQKNQIEEFNRFKNNIALIKRQNESEKKRLGKEIKAFGKKIEEIGQDIISLRKKIDKSQDEFDRIFKKLNISCRKEEECKGKLCFESYPDKCIESALTKATEKIHRQERQLTDFKEKKIYFEKKTIICSGNQKKCVPECVEEMIRQKVSNHSSASQFSEEAKVFNGVLSKFERKQKNELINKFDKFRVLIAPGQKNRFVVMILIKFKRIPSDSKVAP